MQPSIKSEVAYARETLSRFIDEAFPLLSDHWQEVSHYSDIPLDPDLVRYHSSEDQGMLRVYTARVGGKLAGYSVFLVNHNAHYASSLQAQQDVLFVHPDFRRGRLGIRLIDFADAELKAEGVQVVTHHVKVKHLALAAILERKNYELVEVIYAKRLDSNEPRPTSNLATLIDDVLTFFRLRNR